MTDQHLQTLLRRLAGEPAQTTTNPWPRIRARIDGRRSSPRALVYRAALGAATLLLLLGGAAILLVNRTETATAAEILNRMELESKPFVIGLGTTQCLPEPGGLPGAGELPTPTELTDRVGRILGVSGERVRAAMREAGPSTVGVQARVPAAPASGGAAGVSAAAPAGAGVVAGAPVEDPIQRIARDLGLPTETVRAAFANPDCPKQIMLPAPGDTARLARSAQVLAVSPDRLAAVLAAALPPLPPAGASADVVAPTDAMRRIADRLGVTPARLEAAMKEAAGIRAGDNVKFFVR
jgi:hypothetical protein